MANAGPLVANYTFSATSGVAQLIDPLANVTDSTGTVEPSTVFASVGSSGGTTSVDPSTGEINYTPSARFTGVETVTYTVEDSNGYRSAPGTITFNVAFPAPAAPVGTLTTNTYVGETLANTAVTRSVLSADTAATTFAATNLVTLASTPSHGTATVSADRTILYTPAQNFASAAKLCGSMPRLLPAAPPSPLTSIQKE